MLLHKFSVPDHHNHHHHHHDRYYHYLFISLFYMWKSYSMWGQAYACQKPFTICKLDETEMTSRSEGSSHSLFIDIWQKCKRVYSLDCTI